MPQNEQKTTSLKEKIVHPSGHTLPQLLDTPHSIIIGSSLAAHAHLRCGDQVTLYVPQEEESRSLDLNKQVVTVTGIFTVGLDEYDSNAAYCSETMHRLFPRLHGADQLAVTFTPPPCPQKGLTYIQSARAWLFYFFRSEERYHARQIRKLSLLLHGLTVRSWQDLYPELVASLALEKYAMTIVLMLIALVASMLMISLLFMFLQYKRNDIAILRAMGASTDDIYRIFQRLGMVIVIRASLFGLLAAAAIGWWLDTFRAIPLPRIYIVTHLPAAVEPISFFLIFLIILCIGYCACLIPLRTIQETQVAQVVREGS